MDLRHAASGVVGRTGAVLHRLLGQAGVQVHHFSWKTKRDTTLVYSFDIALWKSARFEIHKRSPVSSF